jgi:enoyl-CoA hydratase/carnithine racemase
MGLSTNRRAPLSTNKYLHVDFAEDSGILTVRIDRQDNEKNQIDSGMVKALMAVLYPEHIEPRARGLLLLSAKPKVFSTGADVEGELKDLSATEATLFSSAGREVFGLLSKLSCPTVALLAGFALGGGLELALCCDFRIAARNTRLGFPEINLGVIPGWGGTQRLPRLIGRSRALKMILTGDPLNAATALDYGLVDEVVDGYDALLPAGQKFINKLKGKSRGALAMAKRAINEGGEMSLPDGLALESEIFGLAWSTEDRIEGIEAYMNKRKPRWQD